MQQNLIDFYGFDMEYLVGNQEILDKMQKVPARAPFDDRIIEFLNEVSRRLLTDVQTKQYSDIVTLAFWIRKASVEGLKKRFCQNEDSLIRLGCGTIFHIAPSNVPVNYAYSLFAGLLCGNKNVVRIPSKDFVQVGIINRAINDVLDHMEDIKPYICLVKYSHDTAINDAMSSIADVRVVWGGDHTINELRKSKMRPRSTEITFADRYSLVVIDSDCYMATLDKEKCAVDFYNDTYLSDQNACTSPRAVVWLGTQKEEAKNIFWFKLHEYLDGRYELSGVQVVNKLTSGYLLAAAKTDVKRLQSVDNLIVRMKVQNLTADLMDFKDNSGYFFEYDCKDILELKEFCNDKRCQTLSYIGNAERIKPLITGGIKGVDRIVPVGKTMDFDFIWDGYNLFERMTRCVAIR